MNLTNESYQVKSYYVYYDSMNDKHKSLENKRMKVIFYKVQNYILKNKWVNVILQSKLVMVKVEVVITQFFKENGGILKMWSL